MGFANSVRVSQPVPAPMDQHTKTIHTHMAVRCSCVPEDGCKCHLKHVELTIREIKNTSTFSWTLNKTYIW
jgi:hypothetical protein